MVSKEAFYLKLNGGDLRKMKIGLKIAAMLVGIILLFIVVRAAVITIF